MAGITIGLTVVVIRIVGINVTGVSVNPARSIGLAIVGMSTNANAVSLLSLFIVAPLIGAAVAGLMFQSGLLAAKSE
ncbi:MAG: aquaporin [Alphaproteobacteria bacterium]|jgi:aquaporin Z